MNFPSPACWIHYNERLTLIICSESREMYLKYYHVLCPAAEYSFYSVRNDNF